jgi:hypothetical protein
MSTFRERYGNGPTTWPLWVRVVVTLVLIWVPVSNLIAVLTAEGDPHAAGWLFFGGMSALVAWAILRWLWQPTDASRTEDWQVQRALREGLERDQKVEDAAPLGVHERDMPQRW